MFLLKKLLTALMLPPTGLVLAALFGLWLSQSKSRRWRHGGVFLAAVSLVSLLALALPVTGHALLSSLERYPPVSRQQLSSVQAIVVLGGGSYPQAPEYGGDTVGRATLERVRYGAKLARESRLPLLVTGGAPSGGRPEAELMAEALANEFNTPVRWIEAGSRDTAENARLSAPMLKAAGITRVALVTHGWHLPRAIPLFEREGLTVTPAPTAFSVKSPSTIDQFIPGGLGQSREALHEYLGLLFNHLTSKS